MMRFDIKYELPVKELLKATDKNFSYSYDGKEVVDDATFRTYLDYFHPLFKLINGYDTRTENITAFENIFGLWKKVKTDSVNAEISAYLSKYEIMYNNLTKATRKHEYHKGSKDTDTIVGVNSNTEQPRRTTTHADISNSVYDNDKEEVTEQHLAGSPQTMIENEILMRNKTSVVEIVIQSFVDFALIYDKEGADSWQI